MNSPGARGGGTQISQVSAQPGVPSLPSPDRSRLDAAPFSPPIAGRSPTATHNPTQLPHELGAHEGEAGVGGGGAQHRPPHPLHRSQSKIAENKEGRGCGARAGRCPRRGQTKGPPPTGTAAPRRDPNPPPSAPNAGDGPAARRGGGRGEARSLWSYFKFPSPPPPPTPEPSPGCARFFLLLKGC